MCWRPGGSPWAEFYARPATLVKRAIETGVGSDGSGGRMDCVPAFSPGGTARGDDELVEPGHRGNLRQKQGRCHCRLARIARMIFPLVPRLATLIGLAMFFVLPGNALAHGGVVNDGDLCVINIGYLRAHFKIYVPQERQHQDYCEDIPIRGESVFVME